VPDTSSQLEKYLDIASEAALAAGTIILDNWGKIETIEEKGRSGDLVTEIDRRAETEILKIIGRHFPEHGILAEESGKLPGPIATISGRSILSMEPPTMPTVIPYPSSPSDY